MLALGPWSFVRCWPFSPWAVLRIICGMKKQSRDTPEEIQCVIVPASLPQMAQILSRSFHRLTWFNSNQPVIDLSQFTCTKAGVWLESRDQRGQRPSVGRHLQQKKGCFRVELFVSLGGCERSKKCGIFMILYVFFILLQHCYNSHMLRFLKKFVFSALDIIIVGRKVKTDTVWWRSSNKWWANNSFQQTRLVELIQPCIFSQVTGHATKTTLLGMFSNILIELLCWEPT